MWLSFHILLLYFRVSFYTTIPRHFLLLYIWNNNNSEVDFVFKTQAKQITQQQKCSDYVIGQSSMLWLGRAEPVFCDSLSLYLCVLCYVSHGGSQNHYRHFSHSTILLSHYIICLRNISIPLLLVAANDAKTHTMKGVGCTNHGKKVFLSFLIVKLESKQKKRGKNLAMTFLLIVIFCGDLRQKKNYVITNLSAI